MTKTPTIRKESVFALLLGLFAVTGAWLLKISTPSGLGLTDDAISYVAAARALLNGQGFVRIWLAGGPEPITHWPPLFPALMATVGRILSLDPYRGARVVNILVYGANTALLGWLGWRMTRSYLAGIFLSILFLSNNTFLRLHAYALSEPLYLFVSLLAFLAFAQYYEEEKNKWLIMAGILTGLSYLTRYAALSLLATFIVAIVILRPTWLKRFKSLAIFLAGSLPIMLAWMIRNKLIGGSATNRAMEWHPVTADNIYRGIHSATRFIIPINKWWWDLKSISGFFELLLSIIALALLSWTAWFGLKYFLKSSQYSRPEIIPFTNGLYIFGYLGSLLFSISFFDAATPLIDRILSPIYISLLLMLIVFFKWMWQRANTSGKSIIVSLAIFILAISGVAQYRAVLSLQETAQGFASWRWRESIVMESIRNLPEDAIIYTNQPPAVYFWTDRPVNGISWKAENISQMRESILRGDALLAFFPQDVSTESSQEIRALTEGFGVIEKSDLGSLYGIQP